LRRAREALYGETNYDSGQLRKAFPGLTVGGSSEGRNWTVTDTTYLHGYTAASRSSAHFSVVSRMLLALLVNHRERRTRRNGGTPTVGFGSIDRLRKKKLDASVLGENGYLMNLRELIEQDDGDAIKKAVAEDWIPMAGTKRCYPG